jgi:FkbM family methyltransferase
MKYLFDVGAHWGQDSLDITRDNDGIICYAFEPTPELANQLIEKSKAFANRYHVIQAAISDYDGESDFHLVVGDTGSASLNEFNDNLKETWPGRTDFVVRKTITVPVYKLSTWIKKFAPHIGEIYHLHIDAQGSDLKVLQGLDEMINIVKSGVIEVPQEEKLRLYKNQHTKEECFRFLQENNFVISNITSQVNEDNIFFERKT